ncbi:MAG: histidine-type phosphatase [Muribaculaceae bacterium]|nr:histidine-type phosphatase [Muribaculaceae bacterium]
MKRLSFLVVALVVVAMTTTAGLKEDFKANKWMSANNYWAYPYPAAPLPALTPAPEGYTPFFINHYGRHGSRWLIGKRIYNFPVEQLEIGERNGMLTARGKEVLTILRELRASAQGRDGELSDIGAEQHQGIARRMFRNFPEVFAGDARINARSTVVIRCILSMQNEVDVLKSMNPKLRITTDASEAEMYYMNYSDPVVPDLRKAGLEHVKPLRDKWVNPKHMLKRLFTNQQFARDSIDGQRLMIDLFDVTGNMQSHHQWENTDLYDLFSADDIANVYRYNNARWYILSGENPLTRGRVDFMESHLLRNLVEDGDRAVCRPDHGASLRFGHESVVLPLVCLMGLDGADYSTTDLETLDRHWLTYKIFPMACNVQMVYYRNADRSDILVKILLNEHEATLPIAPVSGPYYRWCDVRDYFLNKLSREPYIPAAIQ